MRWEESRRSENVEDRRGVRGGPVMIGGIGTLIFVVAALLLGIDPNIVFQLVGNAPVGQPAPAEVRQAQPGQPDQMSDFVAAVLGETEDVWTRIFAQMGRRYEEPRLVLFSGQVNSACGFANAAVGPFYCPADQKVYLDLSFFQELDQRFGAPGDFAQAYVIAHEIGHHVQNLLGTSDKMRAAQARANETERNRLSVRLELQADFYAGVWAHHANKMKQILERGDIEEGLRAAQAIGDDRLQRQSRGFVVPDSFTHGTSAQRARWFKKGLETGDLRQGDTFNAPDL